MTPRRSRVRLSAGALLAALVLAAASASAQQWPERTVHVIVGYAPGGTGDVFARLIAEKLREPLGQSFVVENRPGASGSIAAGQVAKAAPDGYTLLLGQLPEIAINPSVMKLDYDTTRDLAPIALIGNATLALVVNADSPYRSVADLIAAARKDRGKLAYATAGTATPGHFAAETLARRANAPMLHAPYKGAGPALTDLLGGHIAFFFSGMPAAMPQVKAGRLRLLAVSTAKRAASSPDTPTVQETVGNFDFSLWGGFFAPAGTSAAIVARLNREVNRVISEPEVRGRLVHEGAEVAAYTPEEFAALVRRDAGKYAKLIAEMGIRLE